MENLDQFTGSDQPDRSAADALTGYGSQIGTEEDTPVRSTENNPPEGSVWREFAQHGNNFKGGAATEFTGWDSQGNAYPRVRAPSSLAASSEYGFGSTRSHTSNNDKVSVTSLTIRLPVLLMKLLRPRVREEDLPSRPGVKWKRNPLLPLFPSEQKGVARFMKAIARRTKNSERFN